MREFGSKNDVEVIVQRPQARDTLHRVPKDNLDIVPVTDSKDVAACGLACAQVQLVALAVRPLHAADVPQRACAWEQGVDLRSTKPVPSRSTHKVMPVRCPTGGSMRPAALEERWRA